MSRPNDETPRVKGRRLSLRVEDRDRELFDRAADANRETLTQFLVAGERERAEVLHADRTRFSSLPMPGTNWSRSWIGRQGQA